MRLRFLGSLRLFGLACAGALWLFTCAQPLPPVSDLGGSEVVGSLVTSGDQPVSGAEVKALRIRSRDSSIDSSDTLVEASVFSEADGTFKLEKLPAEELTLAVFYKTIHCVLQPLRFTPDPENVSFWEYWS